MFDFSKELAKRVCRKLKTPTYLKHPTIAWDNEAYFTPECLYEQGSPV